MFILLEGVIKITYTNTEFSDGTDDVWKCANWFKTRSENATPVYIHNGYTIVEKWFFIVQWLLIFQIKHSLQASRRIFQPLKSTRVLCDFAGVS